jgi:hypothetical protein
MKWINFNEQKPAHDQWVMVDSISVDFPGYVIVKFDSMMEMHEIFECNKLYIYSSEIMRWKPVIIIDKDK